MAKEEKHESKHTPPAKTEVISAEVKDSPASPPIAPRPALDLPHTEPGTYRVTLGDKSAEVEAESANHAWAIFCDAMKSWPPPKRSDRKIERVA